MLDKLQLEYKTDGTTGHWYPMLLVQWLFACTLLALLSSPKSTQLVSKPYYSYTYFFPYKITSLFALQYFRDDWTKSVENYCYSTTDQWMCDSLVVFRVPQKYKGILGCKYSIYHSFLQENNVKTYKSLWIWNVKNPQHSTVLKVTSQLHKLVDYHLPVTVTQATLSQASYYVTVSVTQVTSHPNSSQSKEEVDVKGMLLTFLERQRQECFLLS